MKKKKIRKTPTKITVSDYIKAVKKADRENQISSTIGWQRITKVHKSEKVYNRKRDKKDEWEK